MFSTCLFVHSSIRGQTYEQDNLKTNQPILLQIDTRGPRRKKMKRSPYDGQEVKGQVKVTRRRSYIRRPGGSIIVDPSVE